MLPESASEAEAMYEAEELPEAYDAVGEKDGPRLHVAQDAEDEGEE